MYSIIPKAIAILFVAHAIGFFDIVIQGKVWVKWKKYISKGKAL